ncbi:hypothetical protein MMC13_005709 [Lambiella insularis]|nr:hypothetical protein [Lambiella insularis]
MPSKRKHDAEDAPDENMPYMAGVPTKRKRRTKHVPDDTADAVMRQAAKAVIQPVSKRRLGGEKLQELTGREPFRSHAIADALRRQTPNAEIQPLFKKRRVDEETQQEMRDQKPFRERATANAVTRQTAKAAIPRSKKRQVDVGKQQELPGQEPMYEREPAAPNPIPMGAIPVKNPFLQFDLSRGLKANDVDLDPETDKLVSPDPSLTYGSKAAVPPVERHRKITLVTAGELKYFDKEEEPIREATVFRQLVYLIGIRYHYLDGEDQIMRITSSRHHPRGANRSTLLDSLKKDYD